MKGVVAAVCITVLSFGVFEIDGFKWMHGPEPDTKKPCSGKIVRFSWNYTLNSDEKTIYHCWSIKTKKPVSHPEGCISKCSDFNDKRFYCGPGLKLTIYGVMPDDNGYYNAWVVYNHGGQARKSDVVSTRLETIVTLTAFRDWRPGLGPVVHNTTSNMFEPTMQCGPFPKGFKLPSTPSLHYNGQNVSRKTTRRGDYFIYNLKGEAKPGKYSCSFWSPPSLPCREDNVRSTNISSAAISAKIHKKMQAQLHRTKVMLNDTSQRLDKTEQRLPDAEKSEHHDESRLKKDDAVLKEGLKKIQRKQSNLESSLQEIVTWQQETETRLKAEETYLRQMKERLHHAEKGLKDAEEEHGEIAKTLKETEDRQNKTETLLVEQKALLQQHMKKEQTELGAIRTSLSKATSSLGGLHARLGKVEPLAAETHEQVVALSKRVPNTTVVFKVLFKEPSSSKRSAMNAHPLVFNTVVTNRGNGYDPKTGVFKVPASGLYVFKLEAMGEMDTAGWAEIVAGGEVLGSAHIHTTSAETAPEVVPSVLKKGVQVWVTLKGVKAAPRNLKAMFSGFLVHTEPV